MENYVSSLGTIAFLCDVVQHVSILECRKIDSNILLNVQLISQSIENDP